MEAIETIYCICMGGSPSLHIYATLPPLLTLRKKLDMHEDNKTLKR